MKHGQRCPHLGVSCHRGRSGNGAATRPVPAALSATQTLTLKLSTVMDYFVYLDLKSLEGKGFLSKFSMAVAQEGTYRHCPFGGSLLRLIFVIEIEPDATGSCSRCYGIGFPVI
jgi:hypothetical protein